MHSTIEAKETYYRGKRDLLQRQKRRTTSSHAFYFFLSRLCSLPRSRSLFPFFLFSFLLSSSRSFSPHALCFPLTPPPATSLLPPRTPVALSPLPPSLSFALILTHCACQRLRRPNKCQKRPNFGAKETYYLRTFESLPASVGRGIPAAFSNEPRSAPERLKSRYMKRGMMYLYPDVIASLRRPDKCQKRPTIGGKRDLLYADF
jgi:hypothetical protein